MALPLRGAKRLLAVFFVAAMLPACTTINIVGGDTLEGLSRAQKEMREQAAELSRTVWQSVSQPSFFTSLAGLLVKGADDDTEMPGLIPDTEGARRSAAVAYIEDKQQQYAQPSDQLAAVIADMRRKTLQAQAFVEASKWVVDSHRSEDSSRGADTASSAIIVAGLVQVTEDAKVVEQSIASAQEQKATFETIVTAYREKYPAADVTPLKVELRSFDVQIARMIAISNELSSMQS
jgi:hypothetical protein